MGKSNFESPRYMGKSNFELPIVEPVEKEKKR